MKVISGLNTVYHACLCLLSKLCLVYSCVQSAYVYSCVRVPMCACVSVCVCVCVARARVE